MDESILGNHRVFFLMEERSSLSPEWWQPAGQGVCLGRTLEKEEEEEEEGKEEGEEKEEGRVMQGF